MSGPENGDGGDDPTGRGERIDPEVLSKRIAQATDSSEIKRLLALREVVLGRSVEDVADEFGWSEQQLEAWLADSSNGLPGADEGNAWTVPRLGHGLDSPPVAELVVVSLLTMLFVAILQPGLVLDLRTEIVGTTVDVFTEPIPVSERAELSIATEDVEYLNRIFMEQDAEVGYCGLIDEEGRLRPWLAHLGSATTASLEISVRNCPIGRYERLAILHTHPNGYPRLTAADRSSLGVDSIQYVCIQYGTVSATADELTDRLRCYSVPTDSVQRVPVRVVG